MENNKLQTKLSKKEENKNRVINQALISFIKYGIEGAKISEIAKESGVTERSVFRYFKTKADLVLETSFLFWEKTMGYVDSKCETQIMDNLLGIEQIEYVLYRYADMYFLKRKELVFVHEAESYLNRYGTALLVANKYPAPYEESTGPLASAIRNGLKDGTVRSDLDIPMLYSNTFNGLLGLIQKLAITGINEKEFYTAERKRLESFCKLLVSAYK